MAFRIGNCQSGRSSYRSAKHNGWIGKETRVELFELESKFVFGSKSRTNDVHLLSLHFN